MIDQSRKEVGGPGIVVELEVVCEVVDGAVKDVLSRDWISVEQWQEALVQGLSLLLLLLCCCWCCWGGGQLSYQM